MTISKMTQEKEGKALPSWTDFNKQICEDIPPQNNVGYLPVINGSPTLLKTVHAVFKRSIQIADELGVPEIVLVFDLAFYAKAQQIRWSNSVFLDRTMVRLGEFHTCLSFLGVIGKRFEGCGLEDVII